MLGLTTGVLVLASCAGQAETGFQAGTVVAPGEVRIALAPDFLITVYQGEEILGGEEVKFSELLAQGRPVILNFWAGLCPPCRAEMPDFQRVYDDFQDQVYLIGIDIGPFTGLGSRDDGRALLKELKVTYPAGTTFDANVVKEYRIPGMPTTLFIKPNGEVVRAWAGILSQTRMRELVEELLRASSGM